MELKLPIKLELKAYETKDGWHLSYKEYFKAEDLPAFKNSLEIMKNIPEMDISLNEEEFFANVKLNGTRGTIFDFLCGEFFGLSSFAQNTIQQLFMLAGVGYKALLDKKYDITGEM